MSRIFLEAVPGRVLPMLGKPGQFYGLRRASSRDDGAPIMHRVPGGHDYVSAGPFAVDAREDGYPRDPYLRRAVLRGDLAKAEQPPVKE